MKKIRMLSAAILLSIIRVNDACNKFSKKYRNCFTEKCFVILYIAVYLQFACLSVAPDKKGYQINIVLISL